ncbi:MAG: response regulator [Desulfomonilaceae bacterium]|jgi:chemotaxis family two-component system response regulator Rcp1
MIKPIEILMVEDNPVDVLVTREALKQGRILNNLSVAEDGEEALDFLFRTGQFSAAPRPDLILLDLNLPKKDGREILTELKNNPDLRSIPVVILTTSQAEEDVLRSYDCGANCFIVKPVDLEQFTSTIRCIEDFWFSIVKLPAS